MMLSSNSTHILAGVYIENEPCPVFVDRQTGETIYECNGEFPVISSLYVTSPLEVKDIDTLTATCNVQGLTGIVLDETGVYYLYDNYFQFNSYGSQRGGETVEYDTNQISDISFVEEE